MLAIIGIGFLIFLIVMAIHTRNRSSSPNEEVLEKELEESLRNAWSNFYTPEELEKHIEFSMENYRTVRKREKERGFI